MIFLFNYAKSKYQLTKSEYIALLYRLALVIGSNQTGLSMAKFSGQVTKLLLTQSPEDRKTLAEETLQGLNNLFEIYQASMENE